MRSFVIFCLLTAATSLPLAAKPAASDSGAVIRLDLHESDFFLYRVTFKTTAKRYFPHSDLPSEYSRDLTYFISERIATIGHDGIVTVEANIDSMRLRAERGGDELKFDSQDFHAAETVDLNHPELIGPSMILNKPFSYRMTLEGDFIDLKGFESWIGQIDSATSLDSSVQAAMKEYMAPAFLRRVVVPAEGFVFGRTYVTKQHWTEGLRRGAFTVPLIDSAELRVEFPATHKRYFLYSEGRLFADAREIRDHGFKETALLDSVRGTMRDTVVLAGTGYIQELDRTADMRAWLRTAQLPYSEDIREETIIRLEGYERR